MHHPTAAALRRRRRDHGGADSILAMTLARHVAYTGQPACSAPRPPTPIPRTIMSSRFAHCRSPPHRNYITGPSHYRLRSSQQNARTHTHTRLTALCPGLHGWAGTRKVKPIWILLKQETVSDSEIRWAICKSAPCSRQISTPTTHRSVFLQAGCPSCRPTNSVKALKGIQKYKLLRKKQTSNASTQ